MELEGELREFFAGTALSSTKRFPGDTISPLGSSLREGE